MKDLTNIQKNIYEIRGQRVMLDFDLAALYDVETAQLSRFGETWNASKERILCSR